MKFDKYQMGDGLSQDEFVLFTKLWKDYQFALQSGEVDVDIAFMIKCLENMLEAKTNEIGALNEELYEIATQKSHQHDTQSKETDTSEAPP